MSPTTFVGAAHITLSKTKCSWSPTGCVYKCLTLCAHWNAVLSLYDGAEDDTRTMLVENGAPRGRGGGTGYQKNQFSEMFSDPAAHGGALVPGRRWLHLGSVGCV